LGQARTRSDTHRLVCLFGGTFDPVHYGHLRPLAELQQRLAADAVHVIPAAVPPHRPPPEANLVQRLAMLRLALEAYPGFILDTREVERSGPSYTVLTLEQLRSEAPATRFCLVMGSDAFAGLPTWYHWTRILQLSHVIVIERPGQPAAAGQPWASAALCSDPAELRRQPSGLVWPVSLTPLAISATGIRRELQQGGDVSDKLPDRVLDYIRAQRLYGTRPAGGSG